MVPCFHLASLVQPPISLGPSPTGHFSSGWTEASADHPGPWQPALLPALCGKALRGQTLSSPFLQLMLPLPEHHGQSPKFFQQSRLACVVTGL